VRCGKAQCKQCPPHGPGHGPYWYGFYWDYRQHTRSFYVGKTLPPGVEPLEARSARPAGDLEPTSPRARASAPEES